jgi:peptidoglycan/xylan/chitin deacetylase (PgdA/CDA1 family)
VALIALKVDVDTLRGTQEGVPRLLDILARHQARATFLFSLGPDHTGWALRRVFRPGFLSKVSRTSVLQHYGLRTLMYGVLLPAPDIGQRAGATMRSAHTAGHECGIHTWDHVVWHDQVRGKGDAWTRQQMRLAFERFTDIFGMRPATHGAAGWQMNASAFEQLDDWGMAYASDGRGSCPYNVSVNGRLLKHLQLPTTLPTLDELVGGDGLDERNVAQHLLQMTRGTRDHVYTLHAELEGGLQAPVFDELLTGWLAQGHELVSMGGLYARCRVAQWPIRPLKWGTVPGRSGELISA